MIKDSGDRTKFETGAVRDMHEGKGRMDLLPWAGIMEVSKHCEEGAKKYGEHNVDKGIPVHSLCDSGMRHLAKYLSGWTDEDHLRAAAWNILFALEMRQKHPELVDIPWNKPKAPASTLSSKEESELDKVWVSFKKLCEDGKIDFIPLDWDKFKYTDTLTEDENADKT